MQASFNTLGGKVTITVEGETQQELFETIAEYHEVFAHEKCGVCSNTDVKFQVRMDKDENKYYEVVCNKVGCKAKLPFGCHKKGGGLFPKRRWGSLSEAEQKTRGHGEPKGGYLPHSGWFVWKKEE